MKRVLWLLLLFSRLEALEEVILARQAEAYFEAGEHDKAKALFEKLKQQKLMTWQQERLLYNLGTIALDQGAYQEALHQYASVRFSPESTPFLSRALKTNMAIIYYRQALVHLRRPALTLEDYSRILFLLRESLRHIEEAETAACALQKLEGRIRCVEEQDLKALRKGVKKEQALTAKRYGEAKILETPVKEGLPYLLYGVNQAQGYIDFLERSSLSGELQEGYVKLFYNALASWLPFWDSQVEKLADLGTAKEKFIEGLAFLEKNKLPQGRLAFLTSEAVLSSLMKKLWGEDPLRTVVQKLLVSYKRIVDQVMPQASMLYLLEAEQLQVRDLMQSGGIKLEEADASAQALRESLESVRASKKHHARFYLVESQQWMRRLLRKLTPEHSEDPEGILSGAIEDQEHALSLHHVLRGVEGGREKPLGILRKAQKLTLETVEPFISAVMLKEVNDWPEKCQCQPWKQALPLFFKGEDAAREAVNLLLGEKDLYQAMGKQEDALRFWKEALRSMRDPKEEKQPESAPTQEQEKPSVQEILRMLQNMAKEDKPIKEEQAPPKQGIRPW